ncbi:MAG: hypothetical protein ACD_2C00197G0010 [uncultured bacterium (gcode 4)]|uniref:Helicase ATP-binding domain-containing protein n=1 Tax=uncultured bacterium (gcode 4) TaxID=1234023 RepID=K2GFZ3_9BACT|nr:MAG: hypothetical protein ACD_2C00197G0010 [uncultured bacterium (gcode 4)]
MNFMPWLLSDSNAAPVILQNWQKIILWNQEDWSVIDAELNVISSRERNNIIKSTNDLPIRLKAMEIRDVVRDSIIAVIDAKTWSGKTTEVAKILSWKIVFSEPRVIAAIAAANWVSKWLLSTIWDPEYAIWHKVGYRTWREVKSSHDSDILYVTDWLQLLRQFVSGINPDILIMDEVHTYSIPTEWVLKLMKDLMIEQVKKKVEKKTKLVLMSATIDHKMIADYFKEISTDIPLINVEWRQFSITKEYKTGSDFITSILSSAHKKHDVLAFVEWKKEMASVIEELKIMLPQEEYDIYPLHSEMPIDEQQSLLQKTGNKTVIIIATNVAQESLTIPYIKDVVDNWYRKVLRVNSVWVPELRREEISKADSEQRAWRGWRVQDWNYVFANNMPFENLKDFPDGEIENVTLEKYILISLSVWFDPLKELKRELVKEESKRVKIFIHEPNIDLVQLSYLNLLKIWAINWDLTQDGKVVINATLTPLGRELLNLPLEPCVWKMLKESVKLNCTPEMIDICAIINHKWFLWKNQDWKIFVNNKAKKHSDMIAQRAILKFITSREPLKDQDVSRLIASWVNSQEIKLFQEYSKSGHGKMLFEIVDLTEIWIKSKRVYEVLNTIKILKERLEWSWTVIKQNEIKDAKTWEKHIENIIKCILHWIPNNVFDWYEDLKMFHHEDMKSFIRPNTSCIIPEEKYKYIWLPFIIWWVDGNEDMPLLLFVSRVDEWMLNEVIYSHKNGEYEDLNEAFKDKKIKVVKRKRWRPLEPRILNNLKDDQGWLSPSDLANSITKENLRDVNSFLWLPDYLINQNLPIKLFIKSFSWSPKWEFNIKRFKQLLKLFIPQLVEKFHMEKVHKSLISSYQDDDWYVVELIRASNEPSVKEFLANPYKEQYWTLINTPQNRRNSDADKKRFEEIWEQYELESQLDKKLEKQRKRRTSWKLNLYISVKYKISKNDAKLLIDNWYVTVNDRNTFYLQVFDPNADELTVTFRKDELDAILLVLKSKKKEKGSKKMDKDI